MLFFSLWTLPSKHTSVTQLSVSARLQQFALVSVLLLQSTLRAVFVREKCTANVIYYWYVLILRPQQWNLLCSTLVSDRLAASFPGSALRVIWQNMMSIYWTDAVRDFFLFLFQPLRSKVKPQMHKYTATMQRFLFVCLFSWHACMKQWINGFYMFVCICRVSLLSSSSAASAFCHQMHWGALWPRLSKTSSAFSWASWTTLQSALWVQNSTNERRWWSDGRWRVIFTPVTNLQDSGGVLHSKLREICFFWFFF